MDRLSFVFSLLLIVSVTTITFGSVIEAKNPNGEELEELPSDPDSSPYPEMPRNPKEIEALLSDAGLDHYHELVPNRQELEALLKGSHGIQANLEDEKSLRDENTKISKRISPGTVIAVTRLSMELLQKLLDVIESVDRKIAIGIGNESGRKWQEGHTYFRSGTADEILPYNVKNGKAVLYASRQSDGPVATGTVGVITYYIPDKQSTLGVMWSVPFDYNLYENWWNVKLYRGKQKASRAMYNDLYYHANPFQAGGLETRVLGKGLDVLGFMTTPGNAKLEIRVRK